MMGKQQIQNLLPSLDGFAHARQLLMGQCFVGFNNPQLWRGIKSQHYQKSKLERHDKYAYHVDSAATYTQQYFRSFFKDT